MGTLPKTDNKIAIFASGNGSNAEALLTYAKSNDILDHIVTIVTDNPEAKVIQRASAFQIPVEVIPIRRVQFDTFKAAKREQEQQVLTYLKSLSVNWIVLAGYMRIFSPNFLQEFLNREKNIYQVVNIHPSMLPLFPGKDGYGDAFKANVATSGVTVHFVDDGIDTGPIIHQEAFTRNADDTLESFKARGLALEHEIYPKILHKIVNGTLLQEVKL